MKSRTLFFIFSIGGATLVLVVAVACYNVLAAQSVVVYRSSTLIQNSLRQLSELITPPVLPIGAPARLTIPVIGVDAPIVSVGLTSAGAMGVPNTPTDVAWFKLGPRPGENGSAVIAGHFGWRDNIPAVFDHLRELRKGDVLRITDENGMAMTFVVREIRTYGKDESVPDAFGIDDGKAHLNLITCTGDWIQSEKTRTERLIVFSDRLENSQ